ncbi:hypothetical protein V8E36_004571 [Tilletia maclaganii]
MNSSASVGPGRPQGSSGFQATGAHDLSHLTPPPSNLIDDALLLPDHLYAALSGGGGGAPAPAHAVSQHDFSNNNFSISQHFGPEIQNDENHIHQASDPRAHDYSREAFAQHAAHSAHFPATASPTVASAENGIWAALQQQQQPHIPAQQIPLDGTETDGVATPMYHHRFQQHAPAASNTSTHPQFGFDNASMAAALQMQPQSTPCLYNTGLDTSLLHQLPSEPIATSLTPTNRSPIGGLNGTVAAAAEDVGGPQSSSSIQYHAPSQPQAIAPSNAGSLRQNAHNLHDSIFSQFSPMTSSPFGYAHSPSQHTIVSSLGAAGFGGPSGPGHGISAEGGLDLNAGGSTPATSIFSMGSSVPHSFSNHGHHHLSGSGCEYQMSANHGMMPQSASQSQFPNQHQPQPQLSPQHQHIASGQFGPVSGVPSSVPSSFHFGLAAASSTDATSQPSDQAVPTSNQIGPNTVLPPSSNAGGTSGAKPHRRPRSSTSSSPTATRRTKERSRSRSRSSHLGNAALAVPVVSALGKRNAPDDHPAERMHVDHHSGGEGGAMSSDASSVKDASQDVGGVGKAPSSRSRISRRASIGPAAKAAGARGRSGSIASASAAALSSSSSARSATSAAAASGWGAGSAPHEGSVASPAASPLFSLSNLSAPAGGGAVAGAGSTTSSSAHDSPMSHASPNAGLGHSINSLASAASSSAHFDLSAHYTSATAQHHPFKHAVSTGASSSDAGSISDSSLANQSNPALSPSASGTSWDGGPGAYGSGAPSSLRHHYLQHQHGHFHPQHPYHPHHHHHHHHHLSTSSSSGLPHLSSVVEESNNGNFSGAGMTASGTLQGDTTMTIAGAVKQEKDEDEDQGFGAEEEGGGATLRHASDQVLEAFDYEAAEDDGDAEFVDEDVTHHDGAKAGGPIEECPREEAQPANDMATKTSQKAPGKGRKRSTSTAAKAKATKGKDKEKEVGASESIVPPSTSSVVTDLGNDDEHGTSTLTSPSPKKAASASARRGSTASKQAKARRVSMAIDSEGVDEAHASQSHACGEEMDDPANPGSGEHVEEDKTHEEAEGKEEGKSKRAVGVKGVGVGVKKVRVAKEKDPEAEARRLAERRRRRRENHNAVERRRRDTINEKITELATLLPEAMLLEAISTSTSGGNSGNFDIAAAVKTLGSASAVAALEGEHSAARPAIGQGGVLPPLAHELLNAAREEDEEGDDIEVDEEEDGADNVGRVKKTRLQGASAAAKVGQEADQGRLRSQTITSSVAMLSPHTALADLPYLSISVTSRSGLQDSICGNGFSSSGIFGSSTAGGTEPPTTSMAMISSIPATVAATVIPDHIMSWAAAQAATAKDPSAALANPTLLYANALAPVHRDSAALAAAQAKPNKGIILRKSVDYIRHLQQFLDMQMGINRVLETEVQHLRKLTGAGSFSKHRPQHTASASPSSSFAPNALKTPLSRADAALAESEDSPMSQSGADSRPQYQQVRSQPLIKLGSSHLSAGSRSASAEQQMMGGYMDLGPNALPPPPSTLKQKSGSASEASSAASSLGPSATALLSANSGPGLGANGVTHSGRRASPIPAPPPLGHHALLASPGWAQAEFDARTGLPRRSSPKPESLAGERGESRTARDSPAATQPGEYGVRGRTATVTSRSGLVRVDDDNGWAWGKTDAENPSRFSPPGSGPALANASSAFNIGAADVMASGIGSRRAGENDSDFPSGKASNSAGTGPGSVEIERGRSRTRSFHPVLTLAPGQQQVEGSWPELKASAALSRATSEERLPSARMTPAGFGSQSRVASLGRMGSPASPSSPTFHGIGLALQRQGSFTSLANQLRQQPFMGGHHQQEQPPSSNFSGLGLDDFFLSQLGPSSGVGPVAMEE